MSVPALTGAALQIVAEAMGEYVTRLRFRGPLDPIVDAVAEVIFEEARAERAARSPRAVPTVAAPGSDRSSWVSTEVVAGRLGCSTRWVTGLCDRGDLVGEKVNPRKWLIDPMSVRAYERKRDGEAGAA